MWSKMHEPSIRPMRPMIEKQIYGGDIGRIDGSCIFDHIAIFMSRSLKPSIDCSVDVTISRKRVALKRTIFQLRTLLSNKSVPNLPQKRSVF